MNLEQQTFITAYLRHRSAFTAYCIAYQVEDESQYDSIMLAANQLLDDPAVGGVIRSVQDGIRHEVEQEVRAELKTELLTVQSKRELLARIARGEMTAVQHYKGKDCNHCTQMVLPTINQMLRAIDLDNRMTGQYPDKHAKVSNPQLTVVPENKAEVIYPDPSGQQNTTSRSVRTPSERIAPVLTTAANNETSRNNSSEKTVEEQQNTTRTFQLPKLVFNSVEENGYKIIMPSLGRLNMPQSI